MKIISAPIAIDELRVMAKNTFGDFVKAVVDIQKEIMAIDGDLHADEETLLIDEGSAQNNLWGINLYPDLHGEDFVEFDSMINVRPAIGNRSRGVDSPEIRLKIVQVVKKLVCN